MRLKRCLARAEVPPQGGLFRGFILRNSHAAGEAYYVAATTEPNPRSV